MRIVMNTLSGYSFGDVIFVISWQIAWCHLSQLMATFHLETKKSTRPCKYMSYAYGGPEHSDVWPSSGT